MICPHCKCEIEPDEPPAPVLLKIRGEPMRIVGDDAIRAYRLSKRGGWRPETGQRYGRVVPVLIGEDYGDPAPV